MEKLTTDNHVLRLHYRATVIIFLAAIALVSDDDDDYDGGDGGDDDDDDDDDGGGGGDGGGDDDVFVPKTTFIKFLSRESQFDTIYTKTSDNRRLREQAKVNLAIEMELKQQ